MKKLLLTCLLVPQIVFASGFAPLRLEIKEKSNIIATTDDLLLAKLAKNKTILHLKLKPAAAEKLNEYAKKNPDANAEIFVDSKKISHLAMQQLQNTPNLKLVLENVDKVEAQTLTRNLQKRIQSQR